MTVEELCVLLVGGRYRHPTDEARLQEEIALTLRHAHVRFEREVRLGPGERIDFMVGSVGVEVKVKGAAHAVIRQLLRYSESERVTELVLFTTRAQIVVPDTLGGKPVSTVLRMSL